MNYSYPVEIHIETWLTVSFEIPSFMKGKKQPYGLILKKRPEKKSEHTH